VRSYKTEHYILQAPWLIHILTYNSLSKNFFEDPDSNAVSVIAGAELVSPFEQKLDQFCSLLSDITLYPTRFILSERELVLL
jgi:hypothetical protein